jgi:hypothetical protein
LTLITLVWFIYDARREALRRYLIRSHNLHKAVILIAIKTFRLA